MESKNFLSYQIRWAEPRDWDDAMKMVWETFLKFEGKDYTAEGIANFQDFITSESLYQSFLIGSYQVLIALDGERIIGLASVRNNHHLSLLFVEEAYHNQGVGSALLSFFYQYLRTEMGEKEMTVTSAPYAVQFYKKQGFVATGPEERFAGIRITAMRKDLCIGEAL